MILVDTSVWIDHFQKGNHRLKKILEQESASMQDFVLGELAFGNFRDRQNVLFPPHIPPTMSLRQP